MKVAVVGTGYVGLVSGTCFANLGWNVTCIDKDNGKIEKLINGDIPIYEPGLSEMVTKNVAAGRLEFSTNLKDSVKGAEIIFIAVGTPVSATDEGGADLSYVYAVAKELAPHLEENAVVVIKSTVPVGTGKRVRDIIRAERDDIAFEMVSNPEFLREGCALHDFMEPDRIVVGVESDHGKYLMERLYKPLTDNNIPLLCADIPTAELIKYASNAFLATKIAFINEIADICEQTGSDVMKVSQAMGMDSRIGESFLMPGPGFGGSCFPKDTLALRKIARDNGVPSHIIRAVSESNDRRKDRMSDNVVAALQGDVSGKKIAILGLAFKANTCDVRYSSALQIIPNLLAKGAVIAAYDPEAMEHARDDLSGHDVKWCADAYEAIKGADGVVIVTEWDEFRELDLDKVKSLVAYPLIVDLRNLFPVSALKEKGFFHYSIGHPPFLSA